MNLEEIEQFIIPVLFLIIWVVGRLFGKKGNSLEEPEEPESSQSPDERTRRIQEEIRRKVKERQDAAPEPLEPELPPVAPTAFPRADDPASSALPPEPPPVVEETPAYAAQMAQELHRLEQLRQQAEQLRNDVVVKKSADTSFPEVAEAPVYAWQGLAALNDPYAARNAVLYYEILGPPVGLRRIDSR